MKNTSVNAFLKQNNANRADAFFDYFCSDKALPTRAGRLATVVRMVVKSAKIDGDNMGISLKNNAPFNGCLYDDFRITNQDGDVVFTVVPSSGHRVDQGTSEVWGVENKFERPLVAGSLKDVYAFFGV